MTDLHVDPRALEIVVVAHLRHTLIQQTLDMWADTTPLYREIHLIANHPNTLKGIRLPDRTHVIQTGRPEFHGGCLSESWNLGLMWTFGAHDTSWVILSQDDVRISPLDVFGSCIAEQTQPDYLAELFMKELFRETA